MHSKLQLRRTLAVVLFAVLFRAPLVAQWSQRATAGPSAREYHAMVYDSQRGRVLLFGGGGMNGPLADTWEWDGNAWTQVATIGPARGFHGMAYDAGRGRTVLFGGANGNYLGDTWEWNGSTWTQVATWGPAPRDNPAMAYDSQRGRTVLFGGFTFFSSTNLFGDTWEWNGSTWSQVATSGPGPSVAAMAYDSRRGCTVLFNGTTWERNGGAWMQVGGGPEGRTNFATAYDSQRGRTVLFGGLYNNANPYDDTWEWDGVTWTQAASTTRPSARFGHAMAYDSQRGRTVLFGGASSISISTMVGDTWEWNGVIGTATAFGTGCGSPALALSPVANARPLITSQAKASLTNIPSSPAFMALGWSRTMLGPIPLPLPLAAFGMPGCDLLQSAETAALPTMTTGTGTAAFLMTLPSNASLIGMHVYLQGWANAPGANPASLIVSNGLDWLIGNS